MELNVKIEVDLEGYYIEKEEVLELAEAIADSYREDGQYVASFGFLTYTVKRSKQSCEVVISEGFGFHGLHSGFDLNQC